MIFLFQEPFSKFSKTHLVLAPSPSSKVTVHRKCNKPLEPKKYIPKSIPIIPRGMHFSPLKQISPILKKYSQQRRIVPIVSFSSSSPHKKSPFKTLKPKPNSTIKNTDLKPSAISSNIQKLLTSSAAQTSSTTCDTARESHSVSEQDHVSNVENKENRTEKTSLSTEREDKSTVSKSLKVSETEVSDEVDEEVMEDEQESTAAVVAAAATTGKKHSISKKRYRHQRDLEASLALLQPTVVKDDPMVCYIKYSTLRVPKCSV